MYFNSTPLSEPCVFNLRGSLDGKHWRDWMFDCGFRQEFDFNILFFHNRNGTCKSFLLHLWAHHIISIIKRSRCANFCLKTIPRHFITPPASPYLKNHAYVTMLITHFTRWLITTVLLFAPRANHFQWDTSSNNNSVSYSLPGHELYVWSLARLKLESLQRLLKCVSISVSSLNGGR